MRKLKKVVIVVAIAMLSPMVLAQGTDASFVYEIGGAAPLGKPSTLRTNKVSLGMGVALKTNMACGAKFDPMLSVSNQLNGITDGFKDMMGSVIQAATGFVASLPGMVIQRVNPGLYDILQNGVAQGKYDFELASASCEDFQQMAMNGDGGNWDAWVSLSKGEAWRDKSSQTSPSAEKDPVIIKKEIEMSSGDDGVTWVSGIKRGGLDQQPIRVIKDTVIAGYNMTLGRNNPSSLLLAGIGEQELNPIAKLWGSPGAASDWAIDVIGETEIRTCKECEKNKGIAGKGLVNDYEKEMNVRREKLDEILMNPNFDVDDLMNVSTGSMVITDKVIIALRNERDPSFLLERLSGELALSLTLERSMKMRRILKSGLKEPNIAGNKKAVELIRYEIDALNTEIHDLLFEMDIKDRISRNTMKKIIDRHYGRSRSEEVLNKRNNKAESKYGGFE